MGAHFSSVIGGAQYQAQCLVDVLKAYPELDIYYVTRTVADGFSPRGYKIIQFCKPTGIRRKTFIFDAWSLVSALRRIRPDVIYQRGLKAHTGIVAWYGRRFGCRTYFHVASDFNLIRSRSRAGKSIGILNLIDKVIGEYGIRNVDHVVTQTKGQARLLEENFARKASVVVSNFHPVPESLPSKPDEVFSVIWIGILEANKRPELFAELSRRFLAIENVKFVMIGRAGDEGSRVNVLNAVRASGNLEYLGEQPLESVNDILESAHVLINTSVVEGFPNTFIQGWMRGVPVLSCGVNPDGVFDSRVVGICCDDIGSLEGELRNMIHDTQLWRRMSEEARSYAISRHSPAAASDLIAHMCGGEKADKSSASVGFRRG